MNVASFLRKPHGVPGRVAAWVIASVAAVLIGACASGDVSAPALPGQAEAENGAARENGARQAAGDSPPLLDGDETLLAKLRIAEEDDAGRSYVRRHYDQGGWGDADGDGCNTREEVLIAEAIRLRGVTASCGPVDGAWLSWFDGRTLTDARDVEIDHLVPLAEAHRSGAVRWPADGKRAFADDLSSPHSLTAVSAESNQDKRDSDPSDWRPPVAASWCRYARNWIAVKVKWGLTADEAEAAALREMLATCTEDGNAGPAEHPDRPVHVFPYATCAEAEAAGLERRRGPRGSGSGFPADQVAYARDGDEDGIVCER